MSRTEIFLIILAIYAALSTAAFLLIGHFRKKSKEKQFFEFQDKILHTQMEEMNQIYENMRGWRHDYHNHMQTIKAHLALGQVTEAEDYVDRMEGELDRIDFKYKTGNIGVDAILNSKLTLAEKHGIAVKCDAVLPGEIPVSQLDLCVILGNLIDNAVEACDKMAGGDGHADKDEHRNEDREKSGDEYRNENRDKSGDEHRNENRDKSRDEHRNENRDKSRNEHRNENRDNSKDENGAKHEDDNGDENGEGNPRKFLRLYMCVRKKQLYISVTNATSEVIRKLDWEYISNKRGNHGHGLKRIDLTVAKCGGYINRQNEPGVFATEIMLPLV